MLCGIFPKGIVVSPVRGTEAMPARTKVMMQRAMRRTLSWTMRQRLLPAMKRTLPRTTPQTLLTAMKQALPGATRR
eukprot:2056929-Amphidinium_carterae.1